MKLEHRLAKLEAARGGELDVPNVIFLRSVLEADIDGPLLVAMVLRGPGRGSTLERADGETEAAFELRAGGAAGDLRTAEGAV